MTRIEPNILQATFIKAHLKMVQAGFMPSRSVTKTGLLQKAGAITGVKYKRGQYETAISDLQVIVDAACSKEVE